MTVLARIRPSAQWMAPVLGVASAAAILRAAPASPLPLALASASIGLLVVWIVWQDLSTFTISDAALAAMAVVAFAFRWSGAMGEDEAPAEDDAPPPKTKGRAKPGRGAKPPSHLKPSTPLPQAGGDDA